MEGLARNCPAPNLFSLRNRNQTHPLCPHPHLGLKYPKKADLPFPSTPWLGPCSTVDTLPSSLKSVCNTAPAGWIRKNTMACHKLPYCKQLRGSLRFMVLALPNMELLSGSGGGEKLNPPPPLGPGGK